MQIYTYMYTYSPLGFRSYQCHSRSSSSRGQHIFVSSETSSTRWRKNSREPNRTAQRERLRPLSLQHQPNPRWTQYRWVYLRGGGKKRKGSKVRLMQQTPAGTEKDNFVPWSSLTLVLFSVPPDSPGSFFFFLLPAVVRADSGADSEERSQYYYSSPSPCYLPQTKGDHQLWTQSETVAVLPCVVIMWSMKSFCRQ